jgi:monoamine oxidase
MSHWSDERRIAAALETLAYITGIKTRTLEKEFVAQHFHDWSNDPYARGAYSYIPCGGFRKWKRLCTPFDETLFFAGEATAPGPERGTVHGALRSGERAAKQVLKFLNHATR